jgi:hypothetical protein
VSAAAPSLTINCTTDILILLANNITDTYETELTFTKLKYWDKSLANMCYTRHKLSNYCSILSDDNINYVSISTEVLRPIYPSHA